MYIYIHIYYTHIDYSCLGGSHSTPGVSVHEGDNHLAGVLAALQVASAEHVAGDLPRVRGFALGLAQHGHVQALQQLGVVGCEKWEEMKEERNGGQARTGDGNPGLTTEGGEERSPSM